MRKKLIFGTVLVLTLLLLMPSIPAIQTNVVIEDIKIETVQEKLDEIKELLESEQLDDIKFPLLYKFVVTIYTLQSARILFFAFLILFTCYGFKGYGIYLKHPELLKILDLRFDLIFYSCFIWAVIWYKISDILGWNWPDFQMWWL